LRDTFLYAVPLTYTDPALARQQLRLGMGMQYAADGRFSYSFQGHGVLDSALDLHAAPSDQDLFFLWALTEYLDATGDAAFLDSTVSFYPRDPTSRANVRDHMVASLRHLLEAVGTGPHGLLRLGTGDWSDAIVQFAPDRARAIRDGESVPNSQMALFVLPRVARLLDGIDDQLAGSARAMVNRLRVALPQTFNGEFYGRAYFGDDKLFASDHLELEAQVWGLISSASTDAERERLLVRVRDELDLPSPIGAAMTRGGAVWPAVSSLLTWAYRARHETWAFEHLRRNTLNRHASHYPDLWVGIWTGPDGVQGVGGDPRDYDLPRTGAGDAWISPVTPMADFPAFNNNAHAMPLLAALRTAGINASDGGVRIDLPSRSLSIETALVGFRSAGTSLTGFYRPVGAATLTLRPSPGRRLRVTNAGGAQVAEGREGEVTLLSTNPFAFEATHE
jgi:hypothetical protein